MILFLFVWMCVEMLVSVMTCNVTVVIFTDKFLAFLQSSLLQLGVRWCWDRGSRITGSALEFSYKNNFHLYETIFRINRG